ncbi:hypothetical protein ACKVWL_003433 [Pyricularia oryzae]
MLLGDTNGMWPVIPIGSVPNFSQSSKNRSLEQFYGRTGSVAPCPVSSDIMDPRLQTFMDQLASRDIARYGTDLEALQEVEQEREVQI